MDSRVQSPSSAAATSSTEEERALCCAYRGRRERNEEHQRVISDNLCELLGYYHIWSFQITCESYWDITIYGHLNFGIIATYNSRFEIDLSRTQLRFNTWRVNVTKGSFVAGTDRISKFWSLIGCLLVSVGSWNLNLTHVSMSPIGLIRRNK